MADIATFGIGVVVTRVTMDPTGKFFGIESLIIGESGRTVVADVTLPAGFSNLTYVGVGDFTGTGNTCDNRIVGGSGNDRLSGLAGDDTLNGGRGADTMDGGVGNDTYFVDSPGDRVIDSGGRDLVISTIGYTLGDGVEDLTLHGAKARSATGNALANAIVGNDGGNWVDGRGGRDTLTGGAGADTFAFTAAFGAGNVDTITDFVSGTDRIELAKAVVGALPRGAVSAAAFVQATAAATAQQHILYNATTGVLSYDADGNGAGHAVAFARLIPGQTLRASDFTVV